MRDSYFAPSRPKSTGRDLFNETWLRSMLKAGEAAQAVQATLLELTARSLADAIARYCAGARRLIVCGGGVRNAVLLRRLAELAAPAAVDASDRHGIDPQLVEAAAFAWLAKQALDGGPGNLPFNRGAREARAGYRLPGLKMKAGAEAPADLTSCRLMRRTTSRSRKSKWRSDS